MTGLIRSALLLFVLGKPQYGIEGQFRPFTFSRQHGDLPAKGAFFHFFCRIHEAVGPLIEKWPVNLVGVAEKNDFGAFSGAGNNAFDLVGCHVLGFIDDQIGFFKRPAADKIEGFCLNDLPVKDFVDPLGQFLLVFIAQVFVAIDKLFQIVADRAQQGCYFFLFITGQESDVRIELGVGTSDEDAAIFPGRMIDDLFQTYGKGIKCFGSTGLAFDDDQRCFIGGAHECFLQEILAGIARTDAVGRSIGI